MRKRPLLLGLIAVAGCAVRTPGAIRNDLSAEDAERGRVGNLERAAKYPWMDEGECAVREAAGEWRTLVERCYLALDLSRIRFNDLGHQCTVATADAATMGSMIGLCLLVQPEIVLGAVVVIGVVVIAAAIAAELSKLPCDCICMDIDDLGKTHGPYPIGRRKSAYHCEQDCLRRAYRNGGFCR